ncbi:MAG: (2Fe-2S) ferredoxin domain-containing protein [Prochlorothrix sp.]
MILGSDSVPRSDIPSFDTVSPLLRVDLPQIPLDMTRSKLIQLQGHYHSAILSKKGRLKYLKLAAGGDLITLKIPKLLGYGLCHHLLLGQGLRVIAKRGKKRLKAMLILPIEAAQPENTSTGEVEAALAVTAGNQLATTQENLDLTRSKLSFRSLVPRVTTLPFPLSPTHRSSPGHPPAAPRQAPQTPSTVKIQVCGKGSCKKRGSCKLAQNLNQEIQRSGLESHIQVQMTGCLKQCKQAPNLKLKPQGKILSQVKVQDIPALVQTLLCPSSRGNG